jgi:hypothetical protein
MGTHAHAGAVFWCLLAATPAGAEETHLRYQVMWGGLHAADFALSVRHQGAAYGTRFRLETRGVLDWLLGLEVTATSRGVAPEAAPLAPGAYRVAYTNRRRGRTIAVHFDGDGGLATATVETRHGDVDDEGDEDGEDEARVPEAMRLGVIDPLSALVDALRRVRRHLAAGGAPRFRLAVFDGRRRFDLEGVYAGRGRRAILGVTHDAHRLRLTTLPRAGFNRAHRVLWDGSAFDLFLSADSRFVPLQIVSLGPGPVMNLIAECPQACVLTRPE